MKSTTPTDSLRRSYQPPPRIDNLDRQHDHRGGLEPLQGDLNAALDFIERIGELSHDRRRELWVELNRRRLAMVTVRGRRSWAFYETPDAPEPSFVGPLSTVVRRAMQRDPYWRDAA